MTSLIYYLKKNAYRTPRFLGNAVAHVPYSLRLGFGSDYRNARATRRWLERMGFPPAVVEVPRFDEAGPYPDVDFSEIFA